MPTTPVTGVITDPITLYVPPGCKGEVLFDGDGLNVVLVDRVPSQKGDDFSVTVKELRVPGAYPLEEGRYEFTVPEFSDNFNLHVGLI